MLIKGEIKMGTILGLLLFIFAMHGNFEVAQGAVDSSPDTALRFAQCLIEKMRESRLFTIEDRNSITEVANVMAEAMSHRYQKNISIKILVIAFITSMADVVIHEDPARNNPRKGVYASSIEQCSLSAGGYVDTELIMEALRIIASIEHSKLSRIAKGGERTDVRTYNSNTNIQQPKAFGSLAVQPSPVQVQRFLESFNPSDRIRSEQPNRPFNSYQAPLNPGLNPQFNPSETSGFANGPKTDTSLQAPNFSGFPPNINPGSILQTAANTGFSSGHNFAPKPEFSFGSNVGSGLPIATNKEFPPDSNVGSMLQQRNDKIILPSSDSSQIEETKYLARPQADFSSFGLNIPQTKESSVVVIQPSGNKNVAQTEHFQNNPLQKSGEMGFQPPRLDNPPIPQADFSSFGLKIPQTKESSVVVIPPSRNKNVGQTEHFQNNPLQKSGEMGFQTSRLDNRPISQRPIPSSGYFPQKEERTMNAPFNPGFERTIQNILVGSSIFKDTFNFDISQEKAINLARSVTEQTLKDYNLDLMTKAVAEVSEEVAKVSYQTPENYALALSNALVRVLSLHNLPLFVDGSKIANNFLINLDNAKKQSPQPPNIAEQPNASGSLNPEEKPSDIDFESQPYAPEDTEGEQFSEILQKYLIKSNEFSNFFCNGNDPESRTKILFSVIKLSLSEYGPQLSSIAASIASSATGGQSTEELCSNFAQIISDGISEALEGNTEVLEEANAQDISSKLISNLNLQIQKPSDEGSAEKFPSEYSTVESYDTKPTIQSYYTNDENPTSGSLETNYATSDFLPGQILDADSGSYMIFNGPSSPIQMSPVEQAGNDDYIAPFTTSAYSTEMSDELTNAITITEVILDLWEISSTESSDTVWPSESDDTKDQESLASHLLESFESALGALLDVGSKFLNPTNSSDASLGAVESAEDADRDGAQTNVEQIASEPDKEPENAEDSNRNSEPINVEEISSEPNRRRERKQRRRRKKRTTISDVVTPSIIQTESKNTNYSDQSTSEEITDIGKSPNYNPDISFDRQENGPKVILDGTDSLSSYTKDSIKSDFVELQPSFKGPLSTETKPNQQSNPKFFINNDSTGLIATSVSQKASETIAYIRSNDFNMGELCTRLNELAPIVNIPPLDYCMPVASVDYLLNVLRSTIRILANVN